ncbi:ABC transporter permease [Taibaiella sp. KBW10]|uniref:MlaE family ABC transporter permease n=1 Tax=Taibaiella sp. KBW10 TaxID=2153357 RepID=UPI0018F736B5|nr:ABC transporter permease [Taibaiella sp. KBW10]
MSKFLSHVGRYTLMLKGMLNKPENSKVYWKEFMHQCNDIGYRSLPIVLIIAAFLGAVMTLQSAYQLVSPIIPRYVIAQIVRDSTILELAPTMICVVLAGVVGSKIASELGNMRISEQIDALEIMGINTKTYLILPKIVAALLMVPCLIILAIVISMIGGYAAGSMTGTVLPDQFYYGLTTDFVPFNMYVALAKSFTFAFIISTVPAYYGYHVEGGALEIGRSSTTSVVVSCITILLADYGITALMLSNG